MKKFGKLSRSEMKFVTGGVAAPPGGGTGTCWVTTYGPNYTNPQTGWIYVDSGSADSEANSWCVNQIATAGNGVNHCSYNCGT